MTLAARYGGECPECGEQWQPGDLIRSDIDGWQHAVCPDTPPARTNPVCQVCWLTHPEGACDR